MRKAQGLCLKLESPLISLSVQTLTRHPIPIAIKPCVAALLQVSACFGARGHLAASLPRPALALQPTLPPAMPERGWLLLESGRAHQAGGAG
ncbi:hypothetical protein OF001_U20096 [Pseudomonas sp. OF001]|nr:hypothetical protein OF001_U20096 [Pseudomonas sp. OF001]